MAYRKDDDAPAAVLRRRESSREYERRRLAAINAAKSAERHTVEGRVRGAATTVTADTEEAAARFLRAMQERA